MNSSMGPDLIFDLEECCNTTLSSRVVLQHVQKFCSLTMPFVVGCQNPGILIEMHWFSFKQHEVDLKVKFFFKAWWKLLSITEVSMAILFETGLKWNEVSKKKKLPVFLCTCTLYFCQQLQYQLWKNKVPTWQRDLYSIVLGWKIEKFIRDQYLVLF